MLSRREFRSWRQLLVNQGWRPALSAARFRLRQLAHPAPPAWTDETWQPDVIHPFDEQHGTDTSGLFWGEELPTGGRNDTWITGYYAIAPSIFHRAMRGLPEDLRGYTFVDLGSGKGRALLLATHYGFAEILGLEIAPRLHAAPSQKCSRATFRMCFSSRRMCSA